jgi:hypothetical protein
VARMVLILRLFTHPYDFVMVVLQTGSGALCCGSHHSTFRSIGP